MMLISLPGVDDALSVILSRLWTNLPPLVTINDSRLDETTIKLTNNKKQSRKISEATKTLGRAVIDRLA